MGGISALTALQAGSTIINLLDENKQKAQNMNNLTASYKSNAQKKKNLLEEQLASRRAVLGTQGISSSKSALAVQNRMISDTYDDLEDDYRQYKNKYDTLKESNSLPKQVLQTVTSLGSKMIK